MIQRHQLEQVWPDPPFHLVLVAPEIPGNTGNIARLCAATGAVLHLIDPLGFDVSDAAVKRAGLDYWNAVTVHRHGNLEAYRENHADARRFYFTTRATINYTDVQFAAGDHLVFGSESTGLPQDLLDEDPDRVIGIPILLDHVRSLNLANAASIVLYEALRQANPISF